MRRACDSSRPSATATALERDAIARFVASEFDDEALVEAVESVTVRELAARPLVFGGGFVAEPGRFGGPLMAWWQALGQDRSIHRLDPGATGGGYVRSYEDIEWYRVPRTTRAPHMTGPYVDLLCTDEATLTFTAPVLDSDAFLGVLDADITVPTFGREVGDVLAAAGDAFVVTDDGRVAASADPAVLVQRRVAASVLGGATRTAVPGTRLSVVVRD